MTKKKSLEDLINKEIPLSKEEFFVKLFDYDADNSLSNYFSSQSRFYETKNIKLDFFYKLKENNNILFYVKPVLKNKIGYKYEGKK